MARVPTIIQYRPKYLSLLFSTHLIMSRHATIPVTSADTNPTPILRSTFEALRSPESKSLAILPNISGSTIKNENLAAASRFTPAMRAVEIVAPLRDIPGRSAHIWAIPMISEDDIEISLRLSQSLSAIHSRAAVIHRHILTSHSFWSNKLSSASSKKYPTRAAGIIDTMIYPMSL